MILATVTNKKYILSTINLIESYKLHSFDSTIFLYYFDLPHKALDFLNKRYGSQVVCREVEKVCDYAHEPRTFFYKSYAIKHANDQGADFIYSDGTNAFVRPTKDLAGDLRGHNRLFLQYPYEILKNKYWTTRRCFSDMGCDSPQYHDAPQYWAGFQAYINKPENTQFINKLYEYSLNINILKPDTTIKRPDGEDSPCIEHRQDQSIFSLLIEKFSFQQEYSHSLTNRYGDFQTLHSLDNSFRVNPSEVVLHCRVSKFGEYNYLKGFIEKLLL
jgi:hypothetical protein